jgi:N-acetylneuraminic acid mutarotase
MVLVAGGATLDIPYVTESAELYDPASGTWTITGSLNTKRNGHTATLLQDGMVLVAGGFYRRDLVSAELYDPARGTWTLTGSLNRARRSHTATLLENGTVLVAAGDGDHHNTLLSAEVGHQVR